MRREVIFNEWMHSYSTHAFSAWFCFDSFQHALRHFIQQLDYSAIQELMIATVWFIQGIDSQVMNEYPYDIDVFITPTIELYTQLQYISKCTTKLTVRWVREQSQCIQWSYDHKIYLYVSASRSTAKYGFY